MAGLKMSLKSFVIALLVVCSAGIFLLSSAPCAQAATSSAVWELPQEYFDQNHYAPNDNDWVTVKILRSGDTSLPASLNYAVVDETISSGNGAGQYELLAPNPIVFSPNNTYAIIRIRFHTADHNVFGTQHLTFRLSSDDISIEPGHDQRTVYADYTAIPVLGFASPPDVGYVGAKGQAKPVILNITKEGDAYADSYVDLYATGTAANGVDYTIKDGSGKPVTVPGTIHILPGQSVYSLYISLPDARQDAGNLSVTFTLGNAINANLGSQASATVTVHEKGTAVPTSQPTPTPIPGPTIAPDPTTVPTPNNATPVPLPSRSPGPGIPLCIMAFASIAAACHIVRRNE